MRKLFSFFVALIKEIRGNDLFVLSNQLTYNLLLAIFPFLIFLMSVVGFLNLNPESALNFIGSALPSSVSEMFAGFVGEVVNARSGAVLSVSLLLSIISASNGFLAVVRGINKAYGRKETRNYFKRRLMSVLLVLILAAAIIISIGILVFGDRIIELIIGKLELSQLSRFLAGFLSYFVTLLLLLVTIVLIYEFSLSSRLPFLSLIPGALTTLIVWIAASKLFNVYVNNFSKWSTVYGSVAAVVVLMYWLNIIAFILLVGAEINALLYMPVTRKREGRA